MAHDMFTFDEKMGELIGAYCLARLRQQPIELDFGGVTSPFEQELHGLLTEVGHDPELVMERFTSVIAPRVLSADSERFLAFIPGAPTKAALLFDMVISASSLHAASWLESAGAVAAENEVLRLLGQLAGLPDTCGGTFVGGGSMGNLSALAVARDTGRRRHQSHRVAIACSAESHSSIAGALHLLDVEAVVVPSEDHRFTGTALNKVLRERSSEVPLVGVVATAGTTNLGVIDDLAGIGEVAKVHDLWFHVDGAYGLAGLMSDALRPRFAGLELADSFIVDPHKWLFAPFDSCALLYREPALARATHTQHASYLDAIHTEAVEWNPSDYAVHLSRRPKGLPLWFSLAVHGTVAYGEAVDAGCAIALEAARAIERTPGLELLREPELSIVVFHKSGWTEVDYDRWSTDLVKRQIAFVTPTSYEGKTCARLAFLSPRTTMDIVHEILESMT
jgi:glutamate/tyrosine decarboxylase-like PLP-dependent enzyme